MMSWRLVCTVTAVFGRGVAAPSGPDEAITLDHTNLDHPAYSSLKGVPEFEAPREELRARSR